MARVTLKQDVQNGCRRVAHPPFVTSYDEVPYEGSSFPQTHPDRLATLGRLFGLTPAPIERCRVLELGCAMGSNLVPMAFHLTESEFVGVDASERQVTVAREAAAVLGLSNLRIEHASILDVDREWGQFDYLVCHGVYSWVSDDVQDKILAIAAENLAPHGIAYVSYNTYPGWHMREMIRHMMRYHSGQFRDTPERIEQARALMEFLASSVDTTSLYGALLQHELKLVNRVPDSYLFHDHLEDVNEPLYFHEFIARASRHGLRYLAEADFASMSLDDFPAETAETLERISPDIVHAEQYMDFLRNRLFRQTLLCSAEHRPKRELNGTDLEAFLLASSVVPEPAGGPAATGFRTPDGMVVSTLLPLTHAVLSVLSERWPLALDARTLRSLASERVRPAPDESQLEEQWPVVLQDMLRCYSSGVVELRTWQAAWTGQITPRPRVSRLAAQQARAGRVVTNQLHQAIPLGPVERRLALVLDGSRDRAALLDELRDAVARGELEIEQHDQPITDDRQLGWVLEAALEQTLNALARRALLVG